MYNHKSNAMKMFTLQNSSCFSFQYYTCVYAKHNLRVLNIVSGYCFTLYRYKNHVGCTCIYLSWLC